MKKFIFLFLLLFLSTTIKAQTGKQNFFYFSSHLQFGNYFGGELALNYVHHQKTSYKVAISGMTKKAGSTPDDFSAGFLSSLFFGLGKPHDNMTTYQFAMGRIIPMNKSGTIRTNLSFGLGYTTIEEPTNWRKEGSYGTFNYDWDYREHNTLSFIINPIIEFAFSRFYGLSISPMLQINKDATYLGIGVGQMLGGLRNRKEEKLEDRSRENEVESVH